MQRRGMIARRPRMRRTMNQTLALPGLRALTRNRVPRSARVKGPIVPSRTELKYIDLAGAGYAADTTGSVTALNLCAVGDDNVNRDGRQVTIKSLQVRGIVIPVDDTSGPTLARIMFVWDNAANSGAIATIAQILTASASNAFPLVDNANRFTILRDMTFALGKASNTATQAFAPSPGAHTVDAYMKINQVTQYSGTTAVIGSIQNGALLMVTIGDQAPAAGAQFNIATRVRFVDN